MNQASIKLGFTLVGLAALLSVVILAAWGYVLNAISLVHMIGGDVTALFILRIVGIFAAPLGTLLGWFA